MAQHEHTKGLVINTVLQMQRKNIAALAHVQNHLLHDLQAVTQHQAEFLSDIVKETSTVLQEIANGGTPQEKVVRQADLVRITYENSVAHWHALADLIGRSGKEASELIHDRVRSSLTEMKSALNEKPPKGNGHKKAA